MAKYLALIVAMAACAASTSCLRAFRVQLYNNSTVDLTVHAGDNSVVATLAPGKAAEVPWEEAQWIDFGAIAHLYEYKGAFNFEAFYQPGINRVKIQVEGDGSLYLVTPEAHFPAKPLPSQPEGFPLVPKQKQDLT